MNLDFMNLKWVIYEWLYEFEMPPTKNICCVKDSGAVDHCTVTRWFKKCCLGCKNLDDLEKFGKPKTLESETVLQAIIKPGYEHSEYLMSFAFHRIVWFITFTTGKKHLQIPNCGLTLPKLLIHLIIFKKLWC